MANNVYDAALVMMPPWEPKIAPLGLAYIAEHLKSNGLKVKIIDFNLRLYKQSDERKRIFWNISNINFMPLPEITARMSSLFKKEIDGLTDELISCNAGVIGFSVNITSIGLAGKISSIIKQKDSSKIVVFGGTGCFWQNDRDSIAREDLASIDAFVIGEGEEAFTKIVESRGELINQLSCVLSKEQGFQNRVMPCHISDINSLSFPKFADFDLNSYLDKHVPMLISRGCIGGCVYCIDRLMCGKYRARDAESIIEEMQYHINYNKINDFAFNDLICNGDLRQLEKLCDLIIASGLKVVWNSYAMIRKDMTKDLFDKMHKAGCTRLCYGIESASDDVLKRMNKFYLSDDAKRIVQLTHDAGINTAFNVIVGFPGETMEDFEETISFIVDNHASINEITNISSFAVMQNSVLGKDTEKFGIIIPENKDLNYFVDNRGLDLNGRIKRVYKTVFTSVMLGIKNVIVNVPSYNISSDNNLVMMINLPPARVDMPCLGLLKMHNKLNIANVKKIIRDSNIELFRMVNEDEKRLWLTENYFSWLKPEFLLKEYSHLSDVFFQYINDIVSSGAGRIYFFINKENWMLSCKISNYLKKIRPDLLLFYNQDSSEEFIAMDDIDFCKIKPFVESFERKEIKDKQPLKYDLLDLSLYEDLCLPIDLIK